MPSKSRKQRALASSRCADDPPAASLTAKPGDEILDPLGEQLLDYLARSLAQPMPRRRVLRLAGASLVAVVFPGSRALAARATPSRASACVGKQRRCQKGADGNFEEYCCPPGGGGNGNFYHCGSTANNYACIDKCKLIGIQDGTGPWNRCGEELCCRPSFGCKKGQCVPCPSNVGCDYACCKRGERCKICAKHELWEAPDVLAERRKCCPKGQSCCGKTCVPSTRGVFCCNGKLCPSSKPFCAHTLSAHFCCSRAQFVHDSGTCCPTGTVATAGGDCCPPGQRTC